MNSKLFTSAFLDFIITTGTAFISLLSVDGVSTISDVPQAAMICALLGGLVATAKGVRTYQANPPR